jgi:YspA, cpYpsA-related SLOG family
MRVLVCGGRAYTNRDELYVELDRLHAEYVFTTIIAGGASGVDALVLEWAQARGIATQAFRAEWGTFGRTGRAGPLRNARILAESRPDIVVAFPGGRDTANMVNRAKAAGVWVVTVD